MILEIGNIFYWIYYKVKFVYKGKNSNAGKIRRNNGSFCNFKALTGKE